MKNAMAETGNEIRSIINEAISNLQEKGILGGEAPENFVVEIPGDTKNGDFASNIAMASAKQFHQSPRQIAEAIVSEIDEISASIFEKVEIAGPGFINFYLPQKWFASVVESIGELGPDYGKTDEGKNEKIIVEFVSANPTGPMHLGNARGGALGDSLAEAFIYAGYDTTREFYINNAGAQIVKFGKSLSARYLQLYLGEENIPFPEDGYHGEDIKERAKQFSEIYGDQFVEASEEERAGALIDFALPLNIEKIQKDLALYRIQYDNWFSEKSLYEDGSVDEIIGLLEKNGHTYRSDDGALWLKNTDFGSEKDDVLVRSNGIPTYYAVDIAYHYNKLVKREFSEAIDVFGADHHGHIARLKNALTALGVNSDRLYVAVVQLVRLVQNGETVKMSKRTGKSITLETLLDEVPVDAARFFFNRSAPSSHLDFDLDLAVQENSSNPVYYVQYAHARICHIETNLAAEGIVPRKCTVEELEILNEDSSKELIRALALLPEEIIEVTRQRDPSGLTHYVHDVAGKFHKFYQDCKIKGQEESVLQARLALALATKQVIETVLHILKVSAPEVM